MKTGTPICSKRFSSSACSCFASMRSSVESCSTVKSWASRAARSRSPRVAGGGGGAFGSLGCSLSSIAPLPPLELLKLGRAREAATQLRGAPVGRRGVVERALRVDAHQEHRRSRRPHVEVTLHESASLEILAALIRDLEHVEQRIGEARIAHERRAEILFGGFELACVARAN